MVERSADKSNSRLAGVLLAAGASKRLGQPKQLIRFEGLPLVVRAAKQALEYCDAGLCVVTGAGHDAVVESLERLPARAIYNPGWREGMGASIRQGVANVAGDARAIMILLCDQPKITAPDLANLVDAWLGEPDRIAASHYGNVVGVPAIFPREFRQGLSNLTGDAGAKKLIDEAAAVTVIEMPNAAFDLDTPDQLDKISS